jgi:hypothetical protein
VIVALPSPCSEKDISLYKDITITTGLVQQPDKIVVRFALTIYPYSLGGKLLPPGWESGPATVTG